MSEAVILEGEGLRVKVDRPKAAPTADLMEREHVVAYRDACDAVGVVNPDIIIEDFKHFLNAADMPVFSLAQVRTYMDDLTARDNPSLLGWEWQCVRERDRFDLTFGRRSVRDEDDQDFWRRQAMMQMYNDSLMRNSLSSFSGERRREPMRMPEPKITPASDYFAGREAKVYSRTIPIKALQKVAKIEKEFGVGKVGFLVTEYVTQPHVVINPDPFLMAVVPNRGVGNDIGRFVIDVWDEPGFGIAQMMK